MLKTELNCNKHYDLAVHVIALYGYTNLCYMTGGAKPIMA